MIETKVTVVKYVLFPTVFRMVYTTKRWYFPGEGEKQKHSVNLFNSVNLTVHYIKNSSQGTLDKLTHSISTSNEYIKNT